MTPATIQTEKRGGFSSEMESRFPHHPIQFKAGQWPCKLHV